MRLLLAALLLLVSGCSASPRDTVDPERHDAFWLWAGVAPPPALDRARTIYLLDGEIREREPGHYRVLRPAPPHLTTADVWLVVRTDTLRWPGGMAEGLAARLDRWRAAGNRVAGLQVDFDSRTRGLGDYAAFLTDLRARLPRRYRLSITGLMDWGANGDPKALEALAGTIDEIVIQTYQGRSTIPGYARYFERLRGFPIAFKVGLVEGGQWIEPAGLASNPKFKGYVVFLTARR